MNKSMGRCYLHLLTVSPIIPRSLLRRWFAMKKWVDSSNELRKMKQECYSCILHNDDMDCSEKKMKNMVVGALCPVLHFLWMKTKNIFGSRTEKIATLPLSNETGQSGDSSRRCVESHIFWLYSTVSVQCRLCSALLRRSNPRSFTQFFAIFIFTLASMPLIQLECLKIRNFLESKLPMFLVESVAPYRTILQQQNPIISESATTILAVYDTESKTLDISLRSNHSNNSDYCKVQDRLGTTTIVTTENG